MRSYVLAVVAVGAACAVEAARGAVFGAIDPLMLGALIALAAATQRMPVFLFRSSAIAVSFAAVIASYVLFGTAAGVLVALAQAAVNAFTPRRKPIVKAAFNAGSLVTSAFVGGETFRLLGVAPGDVTGTVLGVSASAAAYFLANTSLTAGVIAISERQPLLAVWRTNYAWMPVNFAATAAQGAALALASGSLGLFGLVVFTLPLGVAWYSFRLYMTKSSEVRARNEELQGVNDLLRRATERLEESHLSVIGALVGALEAKGTAHAERAARTMRYAVGVAEHFGLGPDDIAAVKLGALFHDIGTIGVPESVLRKPGALDAGEWSDVKAHTSIGASLLANVPTLERVRPIVLAHHERYDGQGYPNGLKGDEIPLAAQIIAVTDAFQAMTADRPYRLAMSPRAAIRELRANAGTQFNPVVVEAFVTTILSDRAGARQDSAPIVRQALDAVRAPA